MNKKIIWLSLFMYLFMSTFALAQELGDPYGNGRSLEDFTIIDALNGRERSLSYYSGKSIQRVIVYKKK